MHKYNNIFHNKSKISKYKFGYIFCFCLLIAAFQLCNIDLSYAQSASPSAWHYLDGNPEATRLNKNKSGKQSLDSFKIKWSIEAISGDVQPLIGNIVNNPKINSNFKYLPNEIASIQSGKIAIVDATGKVHKYNSYIPYIKDMTVLIDTLNSNPFNITGNPVVMGIESIELNSPDGLSFGYIAGFDPKADTGKLVRRLTLDLNEYKPNSYANIKPVLGRKFSTGNDYSVFSVINCASPAYSQFNKTLPYLRGIAEFVTKYSTPSYPLPDIKDVKTNRYHVPGDVGFASPSITKIGQKTLIALPYYAYQGIYYDSLSINDYKFQNVLEGKYPYLAAFDVSSDVTKPLFEPINLSNIIKGKKAQIRPYFINSRDRATGDTSFILVAEEYLGRDSSVGTPKLHLFKLNGDAVTGVDDITNLPYKGKTNHQWSIAVGNVDGNLANTWKEYYPNNPGNEIIVTESSRDFAVAGSILSVLRYYSGPRQVKATPPDNLLCPFDTICTQRINGWIAAVNDIDGDADGKDEMFLVDGSILRVLRMNDYMSYEFRSGNPFDTVFTLDFKNQIISNVAVADLEGDGLNDIIVTTQDSTFLIGIEIPNIIKVISPKNNDAAYCVGDTIQLKWHNVTKTSNILDIVFQPTKNQNKFGSEIIIHKDFKNLADTTVYRYVISKNLAGKEGYFIVQQSSNPRLVNDVTGIIQVTKPTANISIANPQSLFAGGKMQIDGAAECVDSLQVEYSTDGNTWKNINNVKVDSTGKIKFEFIIPCPDYFSCSAADNDKYLLVRSIYSKLDYVDTSLTVPLKIKPMPFPVVIEQCTSACPTQNFDWDLSALNNTDNKIYILISTDAGLSFKEIASLDAKQKQFKWNIPTDIPSIYILRFCTGNGCIRTDTLIKRQYAEFINSVSPNPYNPFKGNLEIVYSVKEDVAVSIKILDAANRIVAEPVMNIDRRANIMYCDYWNGRQQDGSYCDNGIYYILLELSNGGRQVYPIFIKK